MLPAEVLEASAKALVDDQGKGFGIAECSHRGKEFDGVLDEAIAKCKSLLSIPDTHDILFLQGGATQLFNTIPMNFLNGTADYVVGGEWSKKAAGSAQSAVRRRDWRHRVQREHELRSPARRAGRPIRAPLTCTSARTRPCTATAWSNGPSTRTWSSIRARR